MSFKLFEPPIANEVSIKNVIWYNFFTELNRLFGKNYEYASFVPSFTGLTIVGTASYVGQYLRDRNNVFFSMTIIPDGVSTTASVAGTTYIDNLPFTAHKNGQLTQINATTKVSLSSSGVIEASTTKGWTPVWTATNDTIALNGQYFIEE